MHLNRISLAAWVLVIVGIVFAFTVPYGVGLASILIGVGMILGWLFPWP